MDRLDLNAVLLNGIGFASMRLRPQSNAARKVARHRRQVLTFVKGDPRDCHHDTCRECPTPRLSGGISPLGIGAMVLLLVRRNNDDDMEDDE